MYFSLWSSICLPRKWEMRTNEAKKSIADNCDNSYCEAPRFINIPCYRYCWMSWQSNKPRQSIELSSNWWILFSSTTSKGLSPRRLLRPHHTLLPSLSCKFIDPNYSRISTEGFNRSQNTKDRIWVRMITLHSLTKIRSFPPSFDDNRSPCCNIPRTRLAWSSLCQITRCQ